MIMKFLAKDMKKLTVIAKRIVTDKKKGTIHLKSNGDGILHVYATNKYIAMYTQLEDQHQESYNFLINPHELDKLLTDNDKGAYGKIQEKIEEEEKEKEQEELQAELLPEEKPKKAKKKAKATKKKLEHMIFKLNQKSIREERTKTSFKVEPVTWQEEVFTDLWSESNELPKKEEMPEYKFSSIAPTPWGYVQEEELFLQIMKESYDTIKDNTDIRTLYMALRSGKSMVTEERRTQLYRLGEHFPFETLYIHKDALQVISTTIKKGDIIHKRTMHGVFFRHKEFLFQVFDDQKTVFPNLRKVVTKKEVFHFDVEGTVVQEAIKKYTAKVVSVVCQFTEDKMIIIPNNPEFETKEIPISNVEGTPIECKFPNNVFKGFFGSFENKITIAHIEYRNVKQKDGYLWRIYTPEQLSVMSGISRLNFELLEKLHKEGKLSKISTLQELEELSLD